MSPVVLCYWGQTKMIEGEIMPKLRNCPNCAAPYDIEKHKCPYCGTSYYDMSAIDFTNGEPFYLKIKTEMNGVPIYITQLVRPSLQSIETSCESVDIYGCCGNSRVKLEKYVKNRTVSTNVSFEAIADKNNNLCTIEVI